MGVTSAGRWVARLGLWLVWLLVLAVLARGAAPDLHADANQDRRVEIGVRLFRALLAADVDLKNRTLEDGRLLVVFFYTDDSKRALGVAKAFSKGEEKGAEGVRGIPTVTEAASDVGFADYAGRRPAAVFLVQPPPGEGLRAIVRYGIANSVVVYSPFEGHVESGVLGGLAIEAQVRPFINLTTLEASRITLKDFFLKVTKVCR